MAIASVIGRGTVVRGNVRGDGSLEILGRVEGDVGMTGDLTLGEDATVRGNLNATELVVRGTVQGDLRGSEAVLVERGARVVGDISAPRIGIAEGALVRGNVRTDGEPPLVQPGRRATGIGQPSRAAAPIHSAKPVAATKPEPLRAAPPPPPPPPVEEDEEDEDEDESERPPARREKAEAPPPVVPALGKGAKAKKKRRDG